MNRKNLMKECLMETEIFKTNKNECLCLDPTLVMNIRHKMVGTVKVKQLKQVIPMPQVLIHAEALKLLRRENHCRLLKLKESKMVENEIAKLKQMLENHRLFAKKILNECKERKSVFNERKFPTQTKLQEKLKCLSEIYNVYTWQHKPVKMTTESKSKHDATKYNVKGSIKQKKHLAELSAYDSTPKDRITENESKNKNQSWETEESNNEIMIWFLSKKFIQVKQELHYDSEKIRENPEIENSTNQKIIEHAWDTWKAYIQKLKNRKREKTIYYNKIETFLIKLREKEARKAKVTELKGKMYLKEGIRAKLILEKRAQKLKKQENLTHEEDTLRDMMKEIKTSQAEARQRLKEIKENHRRNHERLANVEFLKRMDERRKVRLKRREEIEEKKLMRGKERETEQREKEEECKRKSLEELKEKRRLQRERKEEQKKEREKVRLAENHYKLYLLRSYGLRPWRALLKIKDSLNGMALMFFETRLKKTFFYEWMSNARKQMALKVMHADGFYRRILKRKYFSFWNQLRQEKIEQNQVAEDWNGFKIIERAFKKWMNFIQDERISYMNEILTAERCYERKLKLKCLMKLKGYPDFKRLEQARENRKIKWRQKVMEILPDYRPLEMTDHF